MISSPASAAWAAAQTVMLAIRLSDPAIEEWEKKQPRRADGQLVPMTFAVLGADARAKIGRQGKVIGHDLLRKLALEVIKEHGLPMVAEPDGVLCLVPSY